MQRRMFLGALCVGFMINVMPVHADLIWEPMRDSFYSEYADKCEYENRTYIANGQDGEVVVYESPVSEEKVDVWEKGKSAYISFVYEDEKGTVWGIYDNGDETQSGWVKMEHLALKYDAQAFSEEYAEQIVEEEVVVKSDADTVCFWPYPGAKTKNDVKIGEENLTLYTTFMDEAGHQWAYVGYFRGMKNYWICVDAPSAELEELYPDGAPLRGVVLEGTDEVVVDGTQYVAEIGQDGVNEVETDESSEQTNRISEQETQPADTENQVPFVAGIIAGVVAVTGALLALLKKSFGAKK